jgi:flavin reductase (DIM6/NTAB) family NADH-FMN oxidoreductase RutF
MDPPQILVCLNETTETGAAILENKNFAVNILTSAQEQVSNQFAGGTSMDERFKNVCVRNIRRNRVFNSQSVDKLNYSKAMARHYCTGFVESHR